MTSYCQHEQQDKCVDSLGATPTPPPPCHGPAAQTAASCCEAAAPGTASRHDDASSDADTCCETPARRDYFFWGCLLVVAIAYPTGWLLQHEHDSVLGVFTGGVFELFNQMWWGILIGVVFVGILGRVPRELVMGMLGRDGGTSGLFRATLAGVFLDLCSHGILAVGMKLYERGASAGQVMAFLLASPWNSFSLTLILFGLIGVGWTLLFILLSLVIGIVTGSPFSMPWCRRGELPANPWQDELGEQRPLPELLREFRQIPVRFSLSWQHGYPAGRIYAGVTGSDSLVVCSA